MIDGQHFRTEAEINAWVDLNVLDVLGSASSPMTAAEIAEKLVSARGRDTQDNVPAWEPDVVVSLARLAKADLVTVGYDLAELTEFIPPAKLTAHYRITVHHNNKL